MDQFWSWVLTVVGLICFWLAGRRVWWAWYIGIAGQFTWFAYAIATRQWGFIAGAVAYTIVYIKNAIQWTREHRHKQKESEKDIKN